MARKHVDPMAKFDLSPAHVIVGLEIQAASIKARFITSASNRWNYWPNHCGCNGLRKNLDGGADN